MMNQEETLFRSVTNNIQPISPSTHHTQNLYTPQRISLIQNTSHLLGAKSEGVNSEVVDYGGISAHLLNGRVVDSWGSADLLLMGVDTISMLAFFSDDFSHRILAYNLATSEWVETPEDADIDFPRFVLTHQEGTQQEGTQQEGTQQEGTQQEPEFLVHDLESGCTHLVQESFVPQPSSRLTA